MRSAPVRRSLTVLCRHHSGMNRYNALITILLARNINIGHPCLSFGAVSGSRGTAGVNLRPVLPLVGFHPLG